MPQVSCHRWCFRGCGCCALCAAVRQGPRSRPGLLRARAVPAVAVSGARPPRRLCVSLLVLPGSAGSAAVAARPAFWAYGPSPLPFPGWSDACQSSGITSPRRFAGAAITSLPLLSMPAGAVRVSVRQSTGQYHRVIRSLHFGKIAVSGKTVRHPLTYDDSP
jgi:hypothetical protein